MELEEEFKWDLKRLHIANVSKFIRFFRKHQHKTLKVLMDKYGQLYRKMVDFDRRRDFLTDEEKTQSVWNINEMLVMNWIAKRKHGVSLGG